VLKLDETLGEALGEGLGEALGEALGVTLGVMDGAVEEGVLAIDELELVGQEKAVFISIDPMV
jgi:hypothetical protein